MATITPRPHQNEILAYSGGAMGISAVPGSGKTWTLSALAAKLLEGNYLSEEQEILIVTLTNSAVDNFRVRINDFIRTGGTPALIPPYRVRTLHGLANDIVRERPDLVGLDSNFTIIDDVTAAQIRREVAASWLQNNPETLENYIKTEFEESYLDWLRRDHIPKMIQSIAYVFIRTAKDMQLNPAEIHANLERLPVPLPLARMGADLYSDYQRALAYRAAVDFDDLIRLALQGLNTDPDFLQRLQYRWPYILEDEAQDSSRLQEKILAAIIGENGNWVRVGDPNQAIFESFTTANPKYLLNFISECGNARELPNSGRSTQSIIKLANGLIDWTRNEHPNRGARNALTVPHIEPTPPGDPQPNPPDQPLGIHLIPTKYSPDKEIEAVAKSIVEWLPDHPDETIAVLVPRSDRGSNLGKYLEKLNIKFNDSLLKSTLSTRKTTGALFLLLRYLGDPGNPRLLTKIYQVWRRGDKEDPKIWSRVLDISKILGTCSQVEDYIWPQLGEDWLESLDLKDSDPETYESLLEFRVYVRRWQGTVLLPVNQIILTLAQDIFVDSAEIALSHKLAALLRQAENTNPDWRLSQLAGELKVIASNERRFIGFSSDDTGFDPEKYKGVVVISTMHKGKGLEWDRVYLMSVNNFSFPSGELYDQYIPEKWYIRDNLNLEAEVHEFYEEGAASREARLEYIRERLRLFYVGITRAKKELVVTWNTGRKGNMQQSIPFSELSYIWQRHLEALEVEGAE